MRSFAWMSLVSGALAVPAGLENQISDANAVDLDVSRRLTAVTPAPPGTYAISGSVYLGVYVSINPSPPSNPLSGIQQTIQYLLSGPTLTSPTMTWNTCTNFCRAFSYSGIEGGTTCRCGNGFAFNPISALDAICALTCKGNPAQCCGAVNRLLIFHNLNPVTPPPAVSPSLPPAQLPSKAPTLPSLPTPVRPSVGLPSLPVAQLPSLGSLPSLPSPVRPSIGLPSLPVAQLPSLGSLPSLPSPVRPSIGLPSLPIGQVPSLPIGQVPSLSGLPSLPAATLPTGQIPTLPIGQLPSLPLGGLPGTLPGSLPSFPIGQLPTFPIGQLPSLNLPVRPSATSPAVPAGTAPSLPGVGGKLISSTDVCLTGLAPAVRQQVLSACF